MFLNCKSARNIFLFLVIIGWVSGANVVCNEEPDTDGNLSCNLRMDYQEIANAWNLNCEPSESGLSCKFKVKQNGQKTARFFTPKTAQILECSKEGFCIDSVVSTVLKHKPQSQPPERQEKENLNVEADNTQSHRQGVIIGDYEYKEPFDQYAPPIARTLRSRASLWKTPPKDISTEYAFANAHLDLGISHFSAVTTEEYSPGTYSDSLEDSFDLKLAVNAFKVAEKMYISILNKYDDEKSTIFISLGALYLQWGEVYQNSNYFDDEIKENERGEFNRLALEKYQNSEKYYRLALDHSTDKDAGSSSTVKTTKVNLAHVSYRIGRCLVNSMEGASMISVLQEEAKFADQTAEALRNALPQLENLLKIVPKAEQQFAEAIKMYRTAIEEESNFPAKIRLKLNLATTLQDAGTASVYGSNFHRAIELQEEGVEVSKEILPHVGKSDRQYLLQYVGDALYGLANQYMQVGDYESTKLTYKSALEWYEEHNLGLPLVAGAYDVDDASLEAYEKQMSDYRELVREISMPDGYSDGSQPMYAPNNAYEADLHAALGSLHLSRDEVLMSIDHFNDAIRLYEKGADETGENLDRSIADVKVSLATAYFREGEFSKSIESHGEAMDIYKIEIGEGKNPMLAGLAAQLGEDVDLDMLMETTGLTKLLGSAEFQDLLGGVDTSELAGKLDKLSGAGRGEEEVNNNNNEKETKKADDDGEEKVHKKLIDAETIERVRQSIILNATSSAMKGEL